MRGWLWRALGLAAAMAAAMAAGVEAQEPQAGLQEGIFEVSVPSLGALTVPVRVDQDGSVLLPLEAVLEMVGYEVDVLPDRRVWRPGPGAGGARLLLDPPHYVGADGLSFSPPVDAIEAAGGVVYVRTPILARMLDAEATVDWGALRVVLDRRDPPFPGVARARIEARRRRLFRTGDGSDPSSPYRPETGGLVLDWSLGASPTEDRRQARGVLGAAIMGGDLVVGGSVATTPDTTVRTSELSYRRIFPNHGWINQLLLGQVLTQDLAPRSIHGIVISNIPQQRDARFAEVAVRPDVPEGWEYEVYQSGRLLGFSSAGADEAVVVPVRYGQTPLEVRMIGPSGEEVVAPYRYLVPLTHLPPDRTEYSLGAGVCPLDRCDGLGYAELRRGVSRRLTLGGGLQAVGEDSLVRVRPSAQVSIVPDRSWSLDVEARLGEFLRGSVHRVDDVGRSIAVAASVYEPAFGQPSVLFSPGARWQAEAQVGLHPVNLIGRVDGLTGQGVDRVRIGVGRALPRGYGEIALEKGSFGADRVTGRTTTVLPDRWWVRGRPVTVSGSLDATRQGARLLELSGTFRPLAGSYLSTAVRWNRDQDEVLFALTFRQVLDGARISTAATRRAGTEYVTLTADGGLALGGTPGVHFSDRDLQGRAGVVGRVFYDRDGDREFGPSDAPASGVSVLVGGMRVRTDRDGYYRAWNVTPYEITTVAVDTLSGIDPRYTILSGGAILRPVPHYPNRIDFPLTETRELLGRVVTGAGEGVGGVEVVLTAAGGRRITTRTYSDGTFYVSRLLPGEWVARVAPASLEALEATPVPEERVIMVRLADPDPLIEVGPFVLREP